MYMAGQFTSMIVTHTQDNFTKKLDSLKVLQSHMKMIDGQAPKIVNGFPRKMLR
jgi:hypothetical protein